MKYKKIEWFTPEFTEDKLTVTIESNGKLRVSKGFISRLPKSVAFGFNKSTRTMFIRELEGAKGYRPRAIMPVKELPTAIKECGLKLPIRFQISKDIESNYWVGEILLIKDVRGFDIEQLFIIYEPLINHLVHRLGKSIPKEERRSVTAESFCRAAKEYRNIYGNLRRFIKMYLENDLIKENKYYVKQSKEISMDKEYTTVKGGTYSLYDRIADNNTDFEKSENRIMEEDFFNTLNKTEKTILQMLLEKRPMLELCDNTKMSTDEIIAIGKRINRKKEAFWAE